MRSTGSCDQLIRNVLELYHSCFTFLLRPFPIKDASYNSSKVSTATRGPVSTATSPPQSSLRSVGSDGEEKPRNFFLK